MPIVHRPTDGSPLTQGDILRGIPFAVTSVEGNVGPDREAKFVMVISRPCNALRDKAVTVAPVLVWQMDLQSLLAEKTPSSGALDRARRVLAGIRDGGQISDRFYLGPLEEQNNRRYAAQLGTLSTIQVPEDDAARTRWIAERRVWSLHIDLARDLHVRLFSAQARLGFDDEAWLPDPDLEILITQGELELAERQTTLGEAKNALQEKEAGGGSVAEQLRKNVQTREQAVEEARGRLKPYLDERERRRTK